MCVNNPRMHVASRVFKLSVEAFASVWMGNHQSLLNFTSAKEGEGKKEVIEDELLIKFCNFKRLKNEFSMMEVSTKFDLNCIAFHYRIAKFQIIFHFSSTYELKLDSNSESSYLFFWDDQLKWKMKYGEVFRSYLRFRSFLFFVDKQFPTPEGARKNFEEFSFPILKKYRIIERLLSEFPTFYLHFSAKWI